MRGELGPACEASGLRDFLLLLELEREAWRFLVGDSERLERDPEEVESESESESDPPLRRRWGGGDGDAGWVPDGLF